MDPLYLEFLLVSIRFGSCEVQGLTPNFHCHLHPSNQAKKSTPFTKRAWMNFINTNTVIQHNPPGITNKFPINCVISQLRYTIALVSFFTMFTNRAVYIKNSR